MKKDSSLRRRSYYPKRRYYDTFPPDTIYVYGKPWTPAMVAIYRGISIETYKKLRKRFSMEDILTKDSVTANNVAKRAFVDRSEVIQIGHRAWTLAMIYTVAMKDFYEHERVEYRLFAQRVRTHHNTNPHLSLLEVIEDVAEKLGVGLITTRLQRMSDKQYDLVRATYAEFIKANRPKATFYEQADVNKRWYECASEDVDMHWYLFKLHHEMYQSLQGDYDVLKTAYAKALEEIELKKAEIDALNKALIKRINDVDIPTRYVE